MGEEAAWQRMQSELLESWLKIAGASPSANAADFLAGWREAMEGGATSVGTGPWSSFQLFARALNAYSGLLRDSQKRTAGVADAVARMLEDLVAGVDVALKTRVGLGDKAWPEPAAWPAFGLTREWQKLAAELARAVHAEREAALALQVLQWTALRDGAKRMREGLRRKDGPSLTSLKALYDHFIDHLEEAFQAQQQTEAYARAFGEHVNAGLRLREATHASMRKMLPILGVPSLGELESLTQRLSELERTVQQAGDPQPVRVAEVARPTAAAESTREAPVATPPGMVATPRRKSGAQASKAKPVVVTPAKPTKSPGEAAARKARTTSPLPTSAKANAKGAARKGRLVPTPKPVEPGKPANAGGGKVPAATALNHPAGGARTSKPKPALSFDIASIQADRRQKT